jgi:hypothetical protein
MNRCHSARRDDQARVFGVRESRASALDFGGIADVDWTHLDSERLRHALDHGETCDALGGTGISKDRRTLHAQLALELRAICRQGCIRTLRNRWRCRLGGRGAPADVHQQILAVAPAQLLQTLLDRCNAGLPLRGIRSTVHKHAEPPHAIRLLRTHRERPSRNSNTDEHDEFPPPHGICSPWPRTTF